MKLLEPLVIVMAAVLIVVGCSAGSSPAASHDIGGVRECLTKLGLKISKPPSDDADVTDGVFAVSDVQAGAATQLTVALAATAKNDEAVKRFAADSKDFDTQLGLTKGVDMKIQSGSDERYVWIAMGKDGSKELAAATECVKP